MSENQTKNNHFVPIFYLKSFLDNNQQLYQYDLKTKKGYYKGVKDLTKVGSKKNLYTLFSDDKISDKEFELLKAIGQINNENDIFFLHHLIPFLNDKLSEFFTFSSNDEKVFSNVSCDKLKKCLAVNLDNDISRNQEILYSMYENGFQAGYNSILETLSIDNLQELQNNNVRYYIQEKIIFKIYSTLSDKLCKVEKKLNHQFSNNDVMGKNNPEFLSNKYFDFIHYIMSQYFRTDKMITRIHDTAKNFATKHEEVIKSIDDSHGYIKTITNCSKGYINLCMHYFAINCITETVESHKLVLLINESTNVDFIISDQPCMNTYFDLNTPLRKLKESEVEIYFPLSNKLAILYTRKGVYKDISNIKITDDKDIDGYNRALMNLANRYIYGSSNSIKRIT